MRMKTFGEKMQVLTVYLLGNLFSPHTMTR